MKYFISFLIFISSVARARISACSGNLFVVKIDKVSGAIDQSGKLKIPAKFAELMVYPCVAPYPARLPNGKFGFVDANGNWIIQPKYDEVSCFKHGLAVVKTESKSFIIDTKSKALTQAWDDAAISDDEWIVAAKENNIYYLSRDGKVILKSPSDPMQVVLNPKHPQSQEATAYDFLFNGDFAPFKKNNRWGAINRKGVVIIPEQFDGPFKFKNGYAVVTLDKRSGIVNTQGKYILNPSNVAIYDFSTDGNLYPVQKLGTFDFQLYDVKSKKFLNQQYTDSKGCNEGLCIMGSARGSKCDYQKHLCFVGVNYQGKTIIKFPTISGEISIFEEGLIGISDKIGDHEYSLGFVDEKGNLKIKKQFNNVVAGFECGLAWVNVGDRMGYINKKGEFVWNPR